MSAETDILAWLEDSLMMNVRGIGPNVFSYNIEKITPDLMPCITIEYGGTENTESSTTKSKLKLITYGIGIHVINKTLFWDVKTLCDIRESVSQVIETFPTPSVVVDFKEESASAFQTETNTEYSILMQVLNYSFLARESDY